MKKTILMLGTALLMGISGSLWAAGDGSEGEIKVAVELKSPLEQLLATEMKDLGVNKDGNCTFKYDLQDGLSFDCTFSAATKSIAARKTFSPDAPITQPLTREQFTRALDHIRPKGKANDTPNHNPILLLRDGRFLSCVEFKASKKNWAKLQEYKEERSHVEPLLAHASGRTNGGETADRTFQMNYDKSEKGQKTKVDAQEAFTNYRSIPSDRLPFGSTIPSNPDDGDQLGYLDVSQQKALLTRFNDLNRQVDDLSKQLTQIGINPENPRDGILPLTQDEIPEIVTKFFGEVPPTPPSFLRKLFLTKTHIGMFAGVIATITAGYLTHYKKSQKLAKLEEQKANEENRKPNHSVHGYVWKQIFMPWKNPAKNWGIWAGWATLAASAGLRFLGKNEWWINQPF
jgi:hypothetical protein